MGCDSLPRSPGQNALLRAAVADGAVSASTPTRYAPAKKTHHGAP